VNPISSPPTRLLADTAKLTGSQFRSVISEEDRMYFPLDAAHLAAEVESGGVFQGSRVKGEWQNLTGVVQLARFVGSTLKCGLELAQVLAPPVAQASLLLSDAAGRIEQLLLQCPSSGTARRMAPAWDILSQELSSAAKMVVVIPAGPEGQKVQETLQREISQPDKLHFLTNSNPYPMTVWSRDSVLPMEDAQGRTTLLIPQRSYWAGGDPEGNTGDLSVPWVMAESNLGVPITVRPQPWVSLDGGNVVNNSTTAFVGQDSLTNTEKLLRERGSETLAITQLETVLGKTVVVLPQAAFHLDLFCTPLGERKMLVGDPRLALDLLASLSVEQRAEVEIALASQAQVKPEGLLARYTGAGQAEFDQAAAQLIDLGYEVERVPCLLPAERGDPTLSYNNVLIEDYQESDGKQVKKVYLPEYGCQPLDDAARKTYERSGYTVVAMPLAELSCRMGSLRCSALPTRRSAG